MEILTRKYGLAAAAALCLIQAGCLSMRGDVMAQGKGKGYEADPSPMTYKGDVNAFLVGRWSPMMKVSGDLPGISSSQIKEAALPDTNQYWEFKEGGILVMRTRALPKAVGGTWKLEGNAITLAYTTYGGTPLEQARRELQAASEKGLSGSIRNEIVSDWLFQTLPNYTQLTMGQDAKTLEFSSSSALPGMESLTPEQRQLMPKLVTETLIRMRAKR